MDPTDPPLPPDPDPQKIAQKKSAAGAGADVTQKDLAAQLGVSPAAMKKLRDQFALIPGVDWHPGQPILYTPEGVAKLRAALGLPEAQDEPPSADAGTAPAAPAGPIREELTVERPAKGCTHIVLCSAPDGRTVNLRVKAGGNHLFTPGMKVPNCAQHHEAPNLYNFEGRMPRRKGVLR